MAKKELPKKPDLSEKINRLNEQLRAFLEKNHQTIYRTLRLALPLILALYGVSEANSSADESNSRSPFPAGANLNLDPSDLPRPFQIQINFNRDSPNYNYVTDSLIMWAHWADATMVVPDSPYSPFQLSFYGYNAWGIFNTNPRMFTSRYMVSSEGVTVFDAEQDINLETSGCWPDGWTGEHNGPFFGVILDEDDIKPHSYVGNTTVTTQTVSMYNFDDQSNSTPIEIGPGYGVTLADSWNALVSVDQVLPDGTVVNCGGFIYDLSWGDPSRVTPTSTPTPTETDTPVPSDTPTATSTSTKTATPTPTSTRTPFPTPTRTITPFPTQTETPVPSDTPTATSTSTKTATPTPTSTRTPFPTPTRTPTPTFTVTVTTPPTSTSSPTSTPTTVYTIHLPLVIR